MAFLPQELVNAVIHGIDDVPTLKASCLTGSVFREETQRILFRKFKLDDGMRNPDAVYSLLQKSPHIAPYITSLNISFPFGEKLPQYTESLLQIFERLKNVQSCTVAGMPNAGIHAALLSAFLAFLSRQPLRELNVGFTHSLLPVVCLRLITMAPAISFIGVTLSLAQNVDFPMPDWKPAVPRMRELTLGTRSQDINVLLVRAQSQEYTQGLLRISLCCVHDRANGLVFANMRTLEHLELNLQGVFGSPIAIPLLPALRSVQLSVSFREHRTPWFSHLILTLFDGSPLLADLTLELPPSRDTDLHIRAELLDTLDTVLVEHTAAPSIRWRLFLDMLVDDQKDAFNDLVAEVRRGMPRVDEKQRLVLEVYVRLALLDAGVLREEALVGRYTHRSEKKRYPHQVI
ncbi:hypothetical protein C8F04DRAFT_1068169, partial [Mycena alexandri]